MRTADAPSVPLPDGWLELGVVVRPHGVRGHLRARLHNPRSAVIESRGQDRLALCDQHGQLQYGVELVEVRNESLVLRCARCVDRASAESLRGARLVVPRDHVGLDAEEYLVADLIGCDVREGSRCFGKVRDVINAGASDILVIGEGKGERLVPFVDDWVGSVDLVGRTVELRGSDEWDLIAIAE